MTRAENAPPARPAGRSRLSLGAKAGMLGLLGALAWWAFDRFPALVFEDDAYFYAEISGRILAGQGPSFDGIGPTNGFHPLWMGWLVVAGAGLSALGAGSKVAFLGAALLPLAGALWLPVLPAAQVLAASLLLGIGMEGLLSALIVLALARAIDRRSDPLAAPAAAALVLARIDHLAILAVLAGWAALARPGLLAPLLWGVALGAVTSVTVNMALAGLPVGVSALLKGGMALDRLPQAPAFAAWNLWRSPGNVVRLVILCAALVMVMRAARRDGPLLLHPVLHVACGAFLLMHLLLSDLRDWYFAVPVIVALVAGARSMAERPPGRALLAAYVALTLVLPLAAGAWQLKATAPERKAMAGFIERIEAELAPGAPLFAADGSGFLAHALGERPVINGDGLVNTAQYLRNARDPEWLARYLGARGVHHFAARALLGPCPTQAVCCPGEAARRLAATGLAPPLDLVLWRVAEPGLCRLPRGAPQS